MEIDDNYIKMGFQTYDYTSKAWKYLTYLLHQRQRRVINDSIYGG